jgi:hypothetical protein
MASICVDRRSQTYLNKQTINPGPTVNSDGSYTLNQIDVFAKELADNIVAETNNNPIQKMVNKFGDDFGKSIDFINGPFRNNDTKDYPSLNNRFQRGNISNLEMADFMESFNYSPNGVQNQVPDKLLGDLEKYYAGDIFESILGGFCNSMNNLFNQIDAFYDLIGEVDGIINDISAAYTKFLALKGKYEGQIDKALVEQTIVEALMKQIKEKILNSVVKIYQKVMDAIDNFDILDQIGDLVVGIDKSHTKYIMTRKERMCNELTEETQKKMKDKLKGFMDYAFSLFENMDLATMQFLVARFCALASNVEALVNEIKNPLDDYGNRYQRVIKRLQAIGNQNTSTAIRNGAIRFSKERRQDDINSLNRIWESDDALSLSGYEKVSVEPIKAEDYKNLPNCMAVMKGSDGTFGVEGKVFEEKENDKDKERLGFPAYTHLDLDVKVYLKRLQEIYGNKMIITNGWVSTEYTQYKNRPDDAHLSGLVIDIKMDAAFKSKSVEDQAAEALNAALGTSLERDDWTEVFTKNARKSGFKGVIIYNNHIHLDTRDIVR